MDSFTNKISQVAKDIRSGQDALIGILERKGTFFQRLEIYTAVPPNQEMVNKIAMIMVEALFILAIATEEINQSRASKCSHSYVTDSGSPLT